MKIAVTRFVVLAFGLVQVIANPADSFWKSFVDHTIPQVQKQLLDQIAPLLPPSKAIAVQESIKKDLMAPILLAYRHQLQTFDGNQTLTAFDASWAWIEAAEKHWIYWSKNVLPVIMKDSNM